MTLDTSESLHSSDTSAKVSSVVFVGGFVLLFCLNS